MCCSFPGRWRSSMSQMPFVKTDTHISQDKYRRRRDGKPDREFTVPLYISCVLKSIPNFKLKVCRYISTILTRHANSFPRNSASCFPHQLDTQSTASPGLPMTMVPPSRWLVTTVRWCHHDVACLILSKGSCRRAGMLGLCLEGGGKGGGRYRL